MQFSLNNFIISPSWSNADFVVLWHRILFFGSWAVALGWAGPQERAPLGTGGGPRDSISPSPPGPAFSAVICVGSGNGKTLQIFA
jgi:hypothetical protein